MPGRLRALLFDAAGTLIRPREAIGATYSRIAADHGAAFPAERLDEAFVRVFASMPPMVFPGLAGAAIREAERGWWRECVRRVFRAADQMATCDDFDACFETLFAHYAKGDSWCLMPDAAEALRALRDRAFPLPLPLRMAVVSNFDHRLPALLDALEIGSFFEFVAIPSLTGAVKPSAEMFLWALERLDLPPSQVAMIGDSQREDLDASAQCGLLAIGVGETASLATLPARLDDLDRGL